MKLVIERELVSPNRWNGRHWRTKHRLSQDWEKDIWYTARLEPAEPTIVGKCRVSVTRVVPSVRNFIRDTDNLFGACKPLCDALKRLRLIVDDSTEYLELAQPQQTISEDGQHYTVITIEPLGAEAGAG